MTHDIDHLTHMIHSHVGALSYELNRRNGYLAKLDQAIAEGTHVGEQSSPSLRLSSDAKTLRALAEAIEERRGALLGVAPRLRLVAAE